jgi:hypothetical protein
MSLETKLQIERKVIDVVGELYGTYHPIKKVELEDKNWLKSIGISIERDPTLDAAGFNDDYPAGRGVFIDE